MPLVDLNIDLGELPDEPRELYGLATVVNIACGGHAGDQASMARAVSFAMARGARAAAHPSYPDRPGFGRARVVMAMEDLALSIEQQCAALQAIARRLGYPAAIVKPHGALYHDAAADPAIAAAVVDAALRGLGVNDLLVVGPPRGALLAEAHRRGLPYAREGFADRAYRADQSLVPRSEPGALLTDLGACTRQAIALCATGTIETLCVHSDTPDAVAIAGAVREALIQNGYLVGQPDLPGVRVEPFGQGAALVDLGIEASPARAARTHAAAEALRARFPSADVVVGAGTVLVVGETVAEVSAIIQGGGLSAGEHTVIDRIHRIPIVYDGPDLGPAAEALGLRPEELCALHAEREVIVELLGFLPGFAYLGPIDPRLVLPRRPSPRPRIPAGSVGIAGAFTGIYPFASPGGWNLIARAPGAVLFDPMRDPPIFFRPGDRVRFAPISAEQAPPPPPLAPAVGSTPPSRGLRITAALAGATIQDAGRSGQQHRGLPPSGALDPEALARANAAVGNADGVAAIEIPLFSLTVEAEGEVVISIDGERAERLRPGERRVVPACPRSVRYLAVQGGIDVPMVLGARATLLAAKLGGFHGRALGKGDLLAVGEEGGGRAAIAAPMPDAIDDAPLLVDPGPHVDRFPAGALPALLTTTWQVSRLGDRVGVRLEGGKIPRDRPDLALPVPMRRGAVQVSTDGTPIVLGPDHPATGGYPVLAILRAGAAASLGRRRPGDVVRFQLG